MGGYRRARGERVHSSHRPGEHSFESTPPRAGATVICLRVIAHDRVSIHAPRAGATIEELAEALTLEVSIHAPVRGGDCVQAREIRARNEFQSTPLCGGDPRAKPARGAQSCFNPRPRAAGDPRCQTHLGAQCCFNPRPPCGGRRAASAVFSAAWRFQSRPRAGATCTAAERAAQRGSALKRHWAPSFAPRRAWTKAGGRPTGGVVGSPDSRLAIAPREEGDGEGLSVARQSSSSSPRE